MLISSFLSRRDYSTNSYQTDGCAALPNPVPKGLNVSWPAGLTALNNSAMSALWTATGAGMCRPGQTQDCCNITRLSCAQPGAKVFPDTQRPLSMPPIACPPGAPPELMLVVFSGPNCTLQDETRSCYWNATHAAFQGPGCVFTEKTSCACRHLTGAAGRRATPPGPPDRPDEWHLQRVCACKGRR